METVKYIGFLILVFLVVAISFFLFLKQGLFYIVIASFFGIAVFLFFKNEPLKLILIFVFLLPYSGTPIFNYNFMDLTGAKFLHLLAVGLFVVTLLNFIKWKSIPIMTFILAVIIFASLAFNVYRALPDSGKIGLIFFETMDKQQLVLSKFLQPMVGFCPFIFIPLFVGDKKDMVTVVRVLVWTFCVFVSIVFIVWLFFIPDKQNIRSLRIGISSHFGIIANFLVRIIVYGIPLMLARYFVTKNKVLIFFMALSYICVFSLFSRMGYVLGAITILYYFIVSGRKKYLGLIVVLLTIVVMMFSGIVLKRAKYGFETGTVNAISAGRVEHIWKPVLEEHFEDPNKFLFGNGFKSFTRSKVMREMLVVGSTIGHNIYIDLFLDSGIIVAVIYLFCWFYIIMRIRGSIKKPGDPELKEYQVAFYVTLVTYLTGGLTEGSLYPTTYNSIVWVVLTMALLNLNILKESLPENVDV